MATNQNNNIHINSFTKGMNTDTSYDMVSNEQYVFGKNIRITSNTLLGASVDAVKKEGIVVPISYGKQYDVDFNLENKTILATGSIGNIGFVIVKDEDGYWNVYKLTFEKQNEEQFNIQQYTFFEDAKTDKSRFSTVLNKELDDVLNLYIADGEHQIILINLLSSDQDYYKNIKTIDYAISNNIFPKNKASIIKRISGNIPTSQVQYTYRFYKKHGIKSKLAPLTNKIQVINSSRNKEIGNAQDTQTNIGFVLDIPYSKEEGQFFDNIQVYRLVYVKENTDFKVHLIYDGKIYGEDHIKINDNGLLPLQELSIEEFGQLDSLNIVPEYIEQNQGYMFLGNTIDKTVLNTNDIDTRAFQFDGTSLPHSTIYGNTNTTYNNDDVLVISSEDDLSNVDKKYTLNKYVDMKYGPSSENDEHYQNGLFDYRWCKYDKDGYYGGTGKHVSWRFITTPIPLNINTGTNTGDIPSIDYNKEYPLYYIKKKDSGIGTVTEEVKGLNTQNIIDDCCITIDHELNYNDIVTSSLFRSLKRDEIYRYGITFYDNYGNSSNVSWIADIRTPSEIEFPSTSRQYQNSTSEEYQYNSTFVTNNPSASSPITLKPGYSFYITRDITYKINKFKYVYGFNQGMMVPRTHDYSGQNKTYNNIHDIEQLIIDAVKDDIGNYGLYIVSINLNPTISDTIMSDYGNKYEMQQNNSVSNNDVVRIKYDGITYNEKDYHYSTENNVFPDGPGYWYRIYSVAVDIEATVSYNIQIRKNTVIDNTVFNDQLYSYPIGIEFDVHDLPKNIIGYQIVRCPKTPSYTKNLLQCAIARPVRQPLYSSSGIKPNSPYYPLYYLTSQYYLDCIKDENDVKYDYWTGPSSNFENDTLFQIFAPEIQYRRIDMLNTLQSFETQFCAVSYCYGDDVYVDSVKLSNKDTDDVISINSDGSEIGGSCYLNFARNKVKDSGELINDLQNKPNMSFTYKLYDRIPMYEYYNTYKYSTSNVYNLDSPHLVNHSRSIKAIADVLNPTWEQGFSNVQLSGKEVVSGVKQYKSYSVTTNSDQYNNWVSNGMYDLRLSDKQSQAGLPTDPIKYTDITKMGIKVEKTYDPKYIKVFLSQEDTIRERSASGWIGPGPVCFLIKLQNSTSEDVFNRSICIEKDGTTTAGGNVRKKIRGGCLICNIQNNPVQYAGLTNDEKQYDVYNGYGYYFNSSTDKHSVFDGDSYITLCEIVSMYKTYNFNSRDTLPSAQCVYYIPLESSINTCFDYGMNYRNTQSKNLQLEPGDIEGIAIQDRPQYQYNYIYSDNNSSNDIFTPIPQDKQYNQFTQRIFHSDLKTNGESIDSWSTYRTLNYIDTDTRYGEVTNLLSHKNTIYYWQEKAFGKILVNERSLVTDNNGSSILLGQGGVLQRTDYIDTLHGMRKDDMSATQAHDNIFWIDVQNKAIMRSDGNSSINNGETLNVQNVLNEKFDNKIPLINYDVQNDELLCKCLQDDEQLIFNLKLNCATSIYSRKYDNCIIFDNSIFGILSDKLIQFNNIEDESSIGESVIKFVVNTSSSTTKVFDDQEIITTDNISAQDYLTDKLFKFETNLNSTDNTPEGYTNREGNIKYTIPRYGNVDYGNRMRGKWMTVEIKDLNSNPSESISHILTKFRQSFS